MKIFSILLVILTIAANVNAQNNQKVGQPKQNGNFVSHTNPKDVVVYTSNRDDKDFVANLSKKYKGLSDEQKVNDLLKQQNYIEVLNYVWTEPNLTKRIAWLEKGANQGHPILMFELGAAYYQQNPTIETYVYKTMPWLLAGLRRTGIDTQCSSDKSVEAAPGFLLASYQDSIVEDVIEKKGQDQLQKYIEDNAVEFQSKSNDVLKKVMQPLLTDNSKQPSPDWVFGHGLGAFVNEPNTINAKDCYEIRKKFAQDFLKQAEEIDQQIKEESAKAKK